MTDTLIIQKATEELSTKTFGVTEQFLNIHEVVYENDKPKVARVDTEKEDGTAIVYFLVKDEKFYLAVYVDTIPEILVRHVNIESYNSVYFSAVSESLNLEQLSQMTTLKATKGWSKGDKRGGAHWRFSKFIFEPNLEPDEFEDKLKKLLDILESDKEGIERLARSSNVCIQIAQEFHNGNTMLGGSHIDKESIKRIADLDLPIDFDLYVGGNFYKD